MLCPYTCLFALMLIISTIYFHCVVNKNKTVNQYRSQLPTNLQIIYDKISTERLRISYYGYALGLILSFIIIYLYHNKLTKISLICLVIIVSFFTNYFYYILSPKTDYMLNHIGSPELVKLWLNMYKEMQYNYHFSFIVGIISTAILALAFTK